MGNTSKLELPYIKGRPELMVKLGLAGKKARFFKLLIDSGADRTLISKSDAMVLGLDYDKLTTKEESLDAANETKFLAKKARLQITIEHDEFSIPVFIAKNQVQPLLGREGVFDRYEIIFRERDEMVIFKKI